MNAHHDSNHDIAGAAAAHGATAATHHLGDLHTDIAYFAAEEHKDPHELDSRIWDGLLAKHTIPMAPVMLRIGHLATVTPVESTAAQHD